MVDPAAILFGAGATLAVLVVLYVVLVWAVVRFVTPATLWGRL